MQAEVLDCNQSCVALVESERSGHTRQCNAPLQSLVSNQCDYHGITLTCAYHAPSQMVLSHVICLQCQGTGLANPCSSTDRSIFVPIWTKTGSSTAGQEGSASTPVSPRACSRLWPSGLYAVRAMYGYSNRCAARYISCPLSGADRCDGVRLHVERVFDCPWFVDTCTTRELREHGGPQVNRQPKTPSWSGAVSIHVSGTEKETCMSEIVTVHLENKARGLRRGDADGHEDVVRHSLTAGHPLSPHSQLAHPHRARYTVRPVPNAVVRECERPRLYVEYWRAHIRLRQGELYLGSWPLQGAAATLCVL